MPNSSKGERLESKVCSLVPNNMWLVDGSSLRSISPDCSAQDYSKTGTHYF